MTGEFDNDNSCDLCFLEPSPSQLSFSVNSKDLKSVYPTSEHGDSVSFSVRLAAVEELLAVTHRSTMPKMDERIARVKTSVDELGGFIVRFCRQFSAHVRDDLFQVKERTHKLENKLERDMFELEQRLTQLGQTSSLGYILNERSSIQGDQSSTDFGGDMELKRFKCLPDTALSNLQDVQCDLATHIQTTERRFAALEVAIAAQIKELGDQLQEQQSHTRMMLEGPRPKSDFPQLLGSDKVHMELFQSSQRRSPQISGKMSPLTACRELDVLQRFEKAPASPMIASQELDVLQRVERMSPLTAGRELDVLQRFEKAPASPMFARQELDVLQRVEKALATFHSAEKARSASPTRVTTMKSELLLPPGIDPPSMLVRASSGTHAGASLSPDAGCAIPAASDGSAPPRAATKLPSDPKDASGMRSLSPLRMLSGGSFVVAAQHDSGQPMLSAGDGHISQPMFTKGSNDVPNEYAPSPSWKSAGGSRGGSLTMKVNRAPSCEISLGTPTAIRVMTKESLDWLDDSGGHTPNPFLKLAGGGLPVKAKPDPNCAISPGVYGTATATPMMTTRSSDLSVHSHRQPSNLSLKLEGGSPTVEAKPDPRWARSARTDLTAVTQPVMTKRANDLRVYPRGRSPTNTSQPPPDCSPTLKPRHVQIRHTIPTQGYAKLPHRKDELSHTSGDLPGSCLVNAVSNTSQPPPDCSPTLQPRHIQIRHTIPNPGYAKLQQQKDELSHSPGL